MLKRIPHTYVIILGFIVFAAVLTWFIPGGEFQRTVVTLNNVEKEIIQQDSFQLTSNNPQTWQIFSAIFDGFVDKADIIVFILIIGGAFWIMNDSKAIDVGILSFTRFIERIEHKKAIRRIGANNIVIALIMLLFSIFGATFGMSEETIAFVIIFIPLSIKMGYDSIVGVSMCFVGAGLGFAGALLNPFTIGIAQGLSDLPLFSGIEYRFFCWIVINVVGISYILWYAQRIKKNPRKSIVYQEDEYWRQKGADESSNLSYFKNTSSWVSFVIISAVLIVSSILYPVTELFVGNSSITAPAMPILTVLFIISSIIFLRKSVHFFILNILAFTLVCLIVGVMGFGWYIKEIATLFFFMGIMAGIANGKTANQITQLFISGTRDILSAAMVVGLAGGIIIILENGQIIDTLLYYIAGSMEDFGKLSSIGMMYVFQTLINIIIPSGSAKAALTMPIMSQFSDLIGVSRQATVMAFQLGDGFTNMITPTSGILIAVLGIARIPYDKWVRWIGPFMIGLILLGFALLIPTVFMDLSGF
jgi:uncharacterized ion transporter superfamily protein YfcC